jgi:nucleoside-diphosphate-sugar epimerase
MSLYTVVGAAGYVGRRLVATLQRDGAEVYAPVRGDEPLLGRDLGRVFYCAGLTADYLRRPFDTVEAHVSLLARLLERGRFERLVYLSSTRLYDGLADGAGAEERPLLLSPTEPRHLYDFSKGLGETLCLTQAQGRAAVARLSCVFDEAPGAPGFLPEWIDRARRERDIALASATGYVRDYIHLDDTVAALRAILDAGPAEVVNVASGENLSNADLAEVFERHGRRIRFERETLRQAAPLCEVTRLHALGVRPRPARDVLDAILKELPLAPG